ncbi:hypothetical protein PF010_g2576 [Phytophthora fragariae]|uniref:Uncharacterized protein n=1 Tax=Phytophthora fragariae TaxID=53985 RepID=A0A6G0NWD5_9STRA|nr:hypothetical protein PF010_g2576 [Phytophthora fragariae]KAE9225199.1 hypothetical protein PF004_g11988 [Phytophthora fragariae]
MSRLNAVILYVSIGTLRSAFSRSDSSRSDGSSPRNSSTSCSTNFSSSAGSRTNPHRQLLITA